MNLIGSEYIYQNEDGELVTNSYLLAKLAGRQHNQVTRDLTGKDFIANFLCEQNCTHKEIHIAVGRQGGLRSLPVIEFNEYQTYVVTPYILGTYGFDVQKHIVKAFLDAREALEKVANADTLGEAKEIALKALTKFNHGYDFMTQTENKPRAIIRNLVRDFDDPVEAATEMLEFYRTFSKPMGLSYEYSMQPRAEYLDLVYDALRRKQTEYLKKADPATFLTSDFQRFDDAMGMVRVVQIRLHRHRYSSLVGKLERRGIEPENFPVQKRADGTPVGSRAQ